MLAAAEQHYSDGDQDHDAGHNGGNFDPSGRSRESLPIPIYAVFGTAWLVGHVVLQDAGGCRVAAAVENSMSRRRTRTRPWPLGTKGR